MGVGVITASVIPRALGPHDYGGIQFLTATAGAVRSFLDFGASNAAYTYNAKHQTSGLAAYLYGRWLLLQLAVVLLFVVAASALGLAPHIWPEQRVRYVLLITGLEWLTFVGTFLLQLGDSKAETVLVQKINLVAQVLRVGLLLVLYELEVLGLGTFVLVSYAASAFTVAGVLVGLVRRRAGRLQLDQTPAERRECLEFFLSYARPLAVLNVAVLAHDFFDRWFLQTVSGSVEQGYFALGAQWSAIALLFTTSALNIAWREMSLASGANDLARMRSIFRKTTRTFFLISCVIGFLVALNARTFVQGLAGAKYASAEPVLVLLALYPIHQTLGQINGVFYYATERVALYRNLTIGALAGGLVLSYLFLAPTHAPVPGLQLGAYGLALKQVIVNVVAVNVVHAFNTRFLRLSVLRELGYQLGTAVTVGACSGVGYLVVTHLGLENPWMRLAGMSILEGTAIALMIHWHPEIIGVTGPELRGYLAQVRARLRPRRDS